MRVPTAVWSPGAHRVDLVDHTHRSRLAMEPDPTRPGWWVGPDLAVGTDYSFSPDGRGPFPDPRSRWQPRGVDGPSRAWAPDPAHRWVPSPDVPVLGEVIHEVHVGTFTPGGTLDSAAERLGDLRDLGVRTVELMPLAEFSGAFGWGYDGVDLYTVHHGVGGPDALVRFVDRAHSLGLLVCLDVVLNHVGAWGNHLQELAPYFTERHQTPWGPGFDLDGPAAPDVRDLLLGVCRHWLVDLHVDALRLDAVHAIRDDSPRHVLEELADRVSQWRESTGRRLTLIAESDLNQVRLVTPRPRGVGMDAQWADDVHHALHVAFTGETTGYYADFEPSWVLPHVLEDVFLHDGRWSTFRGRAWGAPVPPDVDRRRFVVFSQDHDQVGNRALGERPSVHLDDAQLAACAALVLLSPFTPMTFQGEEWGTRTPFAYFADQETPGRARLVREGRAREFASHGWDGEVPDPTSRATLASSTLDWAERDSPRGRRMLGWYRDLIALRAGLAGVREGRRSWAGRSGVVVRAVNGGAALECTLDSSPIDEGDPPAWPAGSTGGLRARFACQSGVGDAVRVWEWHPAS